MEEEVAESDGGTIVRGTEDGEYLRTEVKRILCLVCHFIYKS